jgi:MinD-like ATPase involved in chromosome partitioning or flagellar assembly
MANNQNQMLAVWGSPSSGKTVTSIKIAAELAKRNMNVVVVCCDLSAPAVPTLIKSKRTGTVSMGKVLEAPVITQELILKNCVSFDKNPFITLLGYKMGESVFDFAEYTKERAVDLLVLLRHIADYVIVDCSSILTDNILSTAALEVADEVLRLCPNDLKALSYFASYMPLIGDRKFKPDKHIKVLSCTRAGGGGEYGEAYSGTAHHLPYIPDIERQNAEMALIEPLSGKDARAYESVIAAIAGEVFGHAE